MRAVTVVATTLGAALLAMTALAGAASGALAAPAPQPTQSSSVISVEIPGETPSPTPTPTPSASATSSPSTSAGGSRNSSSSATPTPEATGAPEVANAPTKGAGILTVGSKTMTPGALIETSASGYQPGEQVQIIMYSTPQVIGSYQADATGTFSARFHVPDGLRAGTHTIEATGWLSHKVTNIEFVLVSATTVGATGSITSVPLIVWLLAILAVLVTSVVILMVYFRSSITRWFGQNHEGGRVQS